MNLENLNVGQGMRAILLTCTVVIVIAIAVRVCMNWGKFTRGQSAFLIGVFGFTVYGGDALRVAIAAGLPFAPRLIAAIVGVAGFFVWMLEPGRLQKASFNGQDPLGSDYDPSRSFCQHCGAEKVEKIEEAVPDDDTR